MCGETEAVKRCSRCKSTIYCSKECQWSHFGHHEKWCKTIASLQKIETEKIYKDKTVRQCQLDWKTQSKMIRLVGRKPMVNCHLDGKIFDMLWDTGSMICLVSRRWLKKHFPGKKIESVSDFLEREGVKELKLTAANATEIKLDGVVVVQFSLKEGEEGFAVPMLVTSENLAQPILGYNVIEDLILNGSLDNRVALQLALRGERGPVEIDSLAAVMEERANNPDFITNIKTSKTITVPAGRRVKVRCRVKAVGDDDEQTVYFQPKLVEGDDELIVSETVCNLKRGKTNYVVVDMINDTKRDKVVGRGTMVGTIHSVSAVIPMVRSVSVAGAGADGGAAKTEVEVNSVNTEIPVEDGSEHEPKWDLSHLEEDQRVMLEEVLKKRQAVFSKSESDIGNITDFHMPINLVDREPVTAAYRKIPPHLYQEVRNYIEDLETNGWIRESFSSYSSPIVCVRKKDGQLRMCVDYRALNAKTIPDSQPIPRIQDILDTLGGSKWFSTFDMSKAYHQGYIDEDSRHLTAFITPWTLYEWIRIPFGLRNAPPAFQRYINQVLRGYKGVICEPYLDDILAFSKDSFEDHVKVIDKILERLEEKGIKLRAEKCVFAKKEVRYLGRLVSEEGYRPDPADTKALEKFKEPPRNVGEVRSLLGFLNYYRCYVRDFSRKVKPLYDLLKGTGGAPKNGKKKGKMGKKQQPQDSKVAVVWTKEHQQILDSLVRYLQSPEVIAYPDFQLPFFIHCDASNHGLGAVLYQTQNDVDRVICYGSRTLSEAEKNYHLHSGKLEFLALKWAITERFADYLSYAPHFMVYTDNNPLTYVLTTAKLNAVGMRWINELADYNFTIKYRPGKENVDADSLSRRPMDITEYRNECSEVVPGISGLMSSMPPVKEELGSGLTAAVSVEMLSLNEPLEVAKVSRSELSRKQREDEVLGAVYRAVAAGRRPVKGEWSELSWESKILMKSFGKLEIKDGILLRRTAKYVQIVLPKEFHKLVFDELHVKLAHIGVEKVVDLAQQRFYWPRMATDIQNFIQKKCRCVANKAPNVKEKAQLVPIQATHPFQMVSIDYLHLDPCKGNFQYALMVTDHFTRFCQIYATKGRTSKEAADKIFNNFIMQFGWPERIHHDLGGEFNSKLFAELHRLTGIRASNTTPYHPMGDGQVERLNRTVINMLKTMSETAKKDWKKHLPKLAFAYNSCVNKSTGFSPFYLMFSRQSRLPIDDAFPEVEVASMKEKTHKEFVADWQKAMEEAVSLARANIDKSAEYNRTYYNKKAKAVELNEGDHVLMRNVEKGGTGKLRSFWEEQIFKVVEKRENLPVYKIQSLKNSADTRLIHRNMLMKVDQLPLDVFEDEEPGKAQKPKSQKVSNSKRVELQRVERVASNKGELAVEQQIDQESEEESEDGFVIYDQLEPQGMEAMPDLVDLTPMEQGMTDGDQGSGAGVEVEDGEVQPLDPDSEMPEPDIPTTENEDQEEPPAEAEPMQTTQTEEDQVPEQAERQEATEEEVQPETESETSEDQAEIERNSPKLVRAREQTKFFTYYSKGQPLWEGN